MASPWKIGSKRMTAPPTITALAVINTGRKRTAPASHDSCIQPNSLAQTLLDEVHQNDGVAHDDARVGHKSNLSCASISAIRSPSLTGCPRSTGMRVMRPLTLRLDRSPDPRAHRADYFFSDRMPLHLDRLHAHRNNRRAALPLGMRRLVTRGQGESEGRCDWSLREGKEEGSCSGVIRLRIKLPDIDLFPGSQNATGGGNFSVSHAIGRPRPSTDDIRMNSLAGETRKYIPAFFTCSALALGDREQKEGANNPLLRRAVRLQDRQPWPLAAHLVSHAQLIARCAATSVMKP